MTDFDPQRPLDDLRELAVLTGGPAGARRLAWTEDWERARAWLLTKLEALGASVRRDRAGNLWAALDGAAGDPGRALVVGSHLDAVPGGGWLDGALGVCAALEALRVHADDDVPIRLVDWADEEGARFGYSLLGSSAAAGSLDPGAVRGLTDADGVTLADALAANGVDVGRMREASLDGVGAYLELHIEQGPQLERLGLPAAAVVGCFGAERHALIFSGRASHAGSTPMELRHDAFQAAARFAHAVREDAIVRGGVATVGAVHVSPGVPTIINERCELTLDQRAPERGTLSDMEADARASAELIAADEGVQVSWRKLFSIDPVPFDAQLVELAARAVEEVTGTPAPRLPSGALHDAAEVARVVPTVMLFASSTGGLSHSPAEDTPEADLRAALAAFGRLCELTALTLR